MSIDPNSIPRRAYIDKMTRAERAIYNALQEVEKVGADVRLTDAVNLLSEAREAVADYVDGVKDVRRIGARRPWQER